MLCTKLTTISLCLDYGYYVGIAWGLSISWPYKEGLLHVLVSLCMWESIYSMCEMLDTLTTLWESFQVGRALSLSPNDRKLRPMGESMELDSCLFGRGMRRSGLECVWL